MSLVWYTTAEFPADTVVDTNDYCGMNRQALTQATAVERAVEDLLAHVREIEFPKAPRRICSFVAVPWPSKKPSQGEGIRFLKDVEYETLPEPPGQGTHCYRVVPTKGGQRWMVDEGLVDELVRKWGSLSAEQAMDLAWAYWAGEIWHSISYLLNGEVKVLRAC